MSGFRATVAAVLLGTMSACLTAPAPDPRSPGTPTTAPQAAVGVEREIHSLINQHRARLRLPGLAYDERLAVMAREHSRAMASGARPFGHDGFDERAAAVRGLFPSIATAENVAYHSRQGPELPRLLVSGWIASAGHRKNIEGAFQLTGVGLARAPNGTSYVTQLFIRRE